MHKHILLGFIAQLHIQRDLNFCHTGQSVGLPDFSECIFFNDMKCFGHVQSPTSPVNGDTFVGSHSPNAKSVSGKRLDGNVVMNEESSGGMIPSDVSLHAIQIHRPNTPLRLALEDIRLAAEIFPWPFLTDLS